MCDDRIIVSSSSLSNRILATARPESSQVVPSRLESSRVVSSRLRPATEVT